MSICPHCALPLVGYELKGVEIDHCPNCGGTWLDSGELDHLLEFEGAPKGTFSEALVGNLASRIDRRRCPRCRRRMAIVRLEGDPAVHIDRCTDGHGLWFDRGELKAAAAAFDRGEEGVVAAYLADLFRHELQNQGG